MLRIAAGILLCVPALLAAQTYPAKSMRVLTPYGAGGSYDALSRLMAHKLGEQLGQQIIVENRPGATGRIGMEIAVKALPDGYTLIMLGNSQAIAPSVHKKVPYDLTKDLSWLSMVGIITNVLVIHPSIPAKNVGEFIALGRKRPLDIRFGSGGTGGITHLAGELFTSMAKVNMTHVPYKAGAMAMNAVISGEIEMNILNGLNASPHVKSGRLRALATTGLKRSRFMPNLPTLDESGLKGYSIEEFYAMAAPANLPAALVSRLNGEIVKAVAAPDMVERFNNQSVEGLTMPPEKLRDYVLAEQAKYAQIVQAVGISAD